MKSEIFCRRDFTVYKSFGGLAKGPSDCGKVFAITRRGVLKNLS